MTPTAAKSTRQLLPLLQRYQGLLGLVLLLIVAIFATPKTNAPGALFHSVFYSKGNLSNVLEQLAVPGALAVGATFVILTGGIDLSAGSLLGLLNCIAAMWLSKSMSGPATAAYVLFLGTAIGAALGFLISVTKLQPFVVTLGAMVSLRGIAYVYTKSANVSGLSNDLVGIREPFLGLPISGWILIVLTVVSGIVLHKTVFGRRVYALGGNEEAARYSGVPINRVRIGAYAINGFCIALAAILFTARTNNGQPGAGVGYELDAIAAAVVGGTSLAGGFGNVFGTFVGALFIVCLNVVLIMQGVDDKVGQGWKGIIILVAVYLQNIGRRKS